MPGWFIHAAVEFFTQLPLASCPAGKVGFCVAAELKSICVSNMSCVTADDPNTPKSPVSLPPKAFCVTSILATILR